MQALDKRATIHDSGWHWGDGVQHEKIGDIDALAAVLERDAGIEGLQLIDPAEEGFAERAAALFHRDGFVCIRDVMSAEHLAELRQFCEQAMTEVVGADEFGGAKGAWRYMFGGSSITGSCMHTPSYAKLSALPAVDAAMTAIFESPNYICYGGGGDFCLPGSEYQPLHSVSTAASLRLLPASIRSCCTGLWGRLQDGA